jgi:prepilin-type N-terminal cleavage/methylation domain-containing protein
MHHPNFPQRQSGFTLIEIAIVLVIIGLLLGGILKGQELINSARVKNLATDFRNVPLFIYGYQDKFRALPGDDPAADAHLGTGAEQAAGDCG